MKEKKLKELDKELKYLQDDARIMEEKLYDSELEKEDSNAKQIAKAIYLKRGINPAKLKGGFVNSIIEIFDEFADNFKHADSDKKGKMVVQIIYIVVVLVLLKVPFDLVKDAAFQYLFVSSGNEDLYKEIFGLVLLVAYLVVFFACLYVLLRNFNNKFHYVKKESSEQ